MAVRCKYLTGIIDEMAPSHLAVEDDNVGLLIGDENDMIDTVLIALDIDDDVINEAIATGSKLIITHHPFIYFPLKSVNTSNFKERMVHKLIFNGINVYAAHTNLDAAESGINSFLAEKFGLTDITVLSGTGEENRFGRAGNLKAPKTLGDFCMDVKSILGIDNVRVVGKLDRKVSRIGLCSGDGTDFMMDAFNMGCDVFLTGDVKYHYACDARDMGMALIDAGHFYTEHIFMPELFRRMKCCASTRNYEVDFILSNVNRNPFMEV